MKMNAIKKTYLFVAYTKDGKKVDVMGKCLHVNGDRAIVISQSRLCTAKRGVNKVWYITDVICDYVDYKRWLIEGEV